MTVPFNRCGNSSSEQGRDPQVTLQGRQAGFEESSWGSSNPAPYPHGAVSWTKMGAELAQSPTHGRHWKLPVHDGD